MRALTALLAVLLVAGCSGGDEEPAPAPSPTTTQPALPSGESWRTGVFERLPLDDFVLEGADAQAVLDANRLLTSRCMRAAGYTYLAARVIDTGSVSYPYGPTDPATVARVGYSQPTLVSDTTDQPTRDDQLLTLAYYRALLGRAAPKVLGTLPVVGTGPVTPADGCTGRAVLGLGPLPDPTALVGELGHQAAEQVPDDQRVRQALDAWSACMDAAGHPFSTPAEARDHDWLTEPAGLQVATATADVGCKAQADLPGTWQRVEAEAQAPLVAAHQAELDQVRARSRAQVARARALLQPGP